MLHSPRFDVAVTIQSTHTPHQPSQSATILTCCCPACLLLRYLSLLHLFPLFENPTTHFVNIYEVLGALALTCRSPLQARVRLMFDLFASERLDGTLSLCEV